MSDFLLSLKKQSLMIGFVLLGLVGYIFCFNAGLFFVHISMSIQTSLICISSYFSLAFISVRKFNFENGNYKSSVYPILWSFLFILISLIISFLFYDYSYDGQTYHGEAIIQLAKGWNPNVKYIQGDDIITLVINHFAKASWINGAFFYLLTGNFECAKATNVILIFSNFFIALPFFSKWVKSNWAILISLLLALNPITLNMYLSNMLDCQAANLIFIFFILVFMRYLDEKAVPLIIIAVPIIYSVNLKFTWVGYYLVFIFFFLLFIIIIKQFKIKRKLVAGVCIFFTMGILFFGYNTYVKNTIEFGHPFYPFKGKENIGKHTTVDALEYRSGNKIINFIKSNFASTTFSEAYVKPLHYKIPFSFSRYEIERYAFAGVMIGGFGVWYSGILVVSLLLLLWLTIKKIGGKKALFVLYFITGVIVISVLINPLSYIARYIPQYYLIPILIFVFYLKHTAFNKKFALLFASLLVINSSLIMGYTAYNIVVTQKIRSQIKSLKKSQKPVLVNFGMQTAKRAIFKDNKINYVEVNSFKENLVPDTIFRSEVAYYIEK